MEEKGTNEGGFTEVALRPESRSCGVLNKRVGPKRTKEEIAALFRNTGQSTRRPAVGSQHTWLKTDGIHYVSTNLKPTVPLRPVKNIALERSRERSQASPRPASSALEWMAAKFHSVPDLCTGFLDALYRKVSMAMKRGLTQ